MRSLPTLRSIIARGPQSLALETKPPGSAPAAAGRSRRPFDAKRIALGLLAVLALLVCLAYIQRDRLSARAADLSRNLIGDENTARIESWYFAVQDRSDRLKYWAFGGLTNPFARDAGLTPLASGSPHSTEVAGIRLPAEGSDATRTAAPIYIAPPKPAPLSLPETKQLRASSEPGEGAWTTAGLPRSSPDDLLMAKTFIRPDATRPYALVGVLLLDKRRIRLHMTGGTQDPGGDRGVKGPGIIPDPDRKDLLAAWNGGFKGPHGGFGMYADARQYRPLRNGLASVAVIQDGTIKIGEWGRDLVWSDDVVAVRQNAVLLVENCEVSKRTSEGNNTWGYVQVNSAEFITWRSAIGLTRNGDLLVAAGNSLSAESLARAMWAAGACSAMELDINTPYVLASLYFPQADGSVKSAKFMDSMLDGPGRFFTTQPRDFMYATLDETNYKP